MRKVSSIFAAVAGCALLAGTALASNNVRISQVYGGGGGGSGTYANDYIELFNNSGSAVSIGGWSLQYGSSTGSSFGSSSGNAALIPAGASIPPCGYYLIQVGTASSSTTGAALPVTPDLVSPTGPNMAAAAGKVALINNQTIPGPACSGNTSGPNYVDVVGYGGGSGSCYETAFTPATSSTTTAVRKGAGTQDTDNNSADFDILASSTVTIHNSSSAGNPGCLSTPTGPSTWGKIKVLYR